MVTHKRNVFSDMINTSFIYMCVKFSTPKLKVMNVRGMMSQMELG